MKTPGNQASGTVVMVDDDLSDIELTKRVIGNIYPRLEVRGVGSGEKMIGYLRGEDPYSDREKFPYPTLVLLDLKMGGMHGFDLLRWMGNNPPHNLIPVVVLTVSGDVALAKHAYKLGARSFLTKPLTGSDFENTMSALQERAHPP
jgi:CheY-like chemotaxis protein